MTVFGKLSARMIRGGKKSERGFILIVVLWFVALLALIAGTFLTTVRYNVRIAANQIGNRQAELNADAAVRLTAFHLASASQQDLRAGSVPLGGAVTACELPGNGSVLVAVQDHAGLVDLNAASPDLLRKLFISAGVAPAEATGLANSTVDFRDADDNSRNGGSEASDYRGAGLAAGPKNGFFQTRWELDQVPGLTLELMETLSERITVHSRSTGLDPGVMPFELELSGNQIRPSRLQVFTIIAEVQVGSRGRYVRRAVIRLTRQPGAPFQVLSWERGLKRLSSGEQADQIRSGNGICAFFPPQP